ncbi:hypothetical protein B0H13DRAFT_1925231 [Mycena leptocephala]|nr:hypothetical protein B0H13DRAFT_1925231 [Mycena leptocephala]
MLTFFTKLAAVLVIAATQAAATSSYSIGYYFDSDCQNELGSSGGSFTSSGCLGGTSGVNSIWIFSLSNAKISTYSDLNCKINERPVPATCPTLGCASLLLEPTPSGTESGYQIPVGWHCASVYGATVLTRSRGFMSWYLIPWVPAGRKLPELVQYGYHSIAMNEAIIIHPDIMGFAARDGRYDGFLFGQNSAVSAQFEPTGRRGGTNRCLRCWPFKGDFWTPQTMSHGGGGRRANIFVCFRTFWTVERVARDCMGQSWDFNGNLSIRSQWWPKSKEGPIPSAVPSGHRDRWWQAELEAVRSRRGGARPPSGQRGLQSARRRRSIQERVHHEYFGEFPFRPTFRIVEAIAWAPMSRPPQWLPTTEEGPIPGAVPSAHREWQRRAEFAWFDRSADRRASPSHRGRLVSVQNPCQASWGITLASWNLWKSAGPVTGIELRRRRASGNHQCPSAVVGDLRGICPVNSGAGRRRHRPALSRSEYFGDLPPTSDVADYRGHSAGMHGPIMGFPRKPVDGTPVVAHTRGGPDSLSGSFGTP